MKTTLWNVVYGGLLTTSVILHIAARNAHHAYVLAHSAVQRATDPATHFATGAISPETFYRQSGQAFLGIIAITASLFIIAFFKRNWLAWTATLISFLIALLTQLTTGYRV